MLCLQFLWLDTIFDNGTNRFTWADGTAEGSQPWLRKEGNAGYWAKLSSVSCLLHHLHAHAGPLNLFASIDPEGRL